MNKELSAGTTDEKSTKADNQHVSPACIKPNVSGCRVRPILFSGEMVRAILEGRKTQTRRIIKEIPAETKLIWFDNAEWIVENDEGRCWKGQLKQRYKVGDILWVRETWQLTNSSIAIYPGYVYRATDPDWESMEGWTWKPSIFMPREAARIFLKVTGIRVERLHNINTNDLKAEGVNFVLDYGPMIFQNFKELWTKINGADSWKLNPFVWAINFERCERPMDSH